MGGVYSLFIPPPKFLLPTLISDYCSFFLKVIHQDYQNSLQKLIKLSGRYKKIISCHGPVEAPPFIIKEILTCVESIINGKQRGVPYSTFAGDGLLFSCITGCAYYLAQESRFLSPLVPGSWWMFSNNRCLPWLPCSSSSQSWEFGLSPSLGILWTESVRK